MTAPFLLALAGCGVKSTPQPPEAVRPERIVDLAAAADKDGIRLEWARPERHESGGTLRDLAGFVVLRAQGSAEMKPLVELPLTDRERFVKQHRFEYVDRETQVGRTYSYEVISVTDSGYQSAPSNLIVFTRSAPAPVPKLKNFALPSPSPSP